MEQVWRALGAEGEEGRAGDVAAAGDWAGGGGRRLVIRDEGGEKFWEGVTDGRQLIIRWGKTGSRPQVSLKTFVDEQTAQEELNRLEEEQKQKGYGPPL
jgi:predicted DNA-binding WGR domain protein